MLSPFTLEQQSPTSADLEREVRSELSARLASESRASDLVHVLLAALVALLIWPDVTHAAAIAWAAAIAVVALGRAAVRTRVRAPGASRDHVVRVMRVGVAANALAWGLGLLIIGRSLPVESLALLTIVVVGIIAGASIALLADPPSFLIMLAGLIAPLTVALAISGASRSHAFGAVFVAVFGVLMSFYYRRSHGALVKQIRIAHELARTAAEAQAARESAGQMVRVVESTTDLVGITTGEGRLLYLNGAGRAMLGIEPDEDVTALKVTDLTPRRIHDVVVREHIPAVLRDGVWRGESVLLHRDGHETPISSVAIAHRDADGTVQTMSIVGRDMTDQVAAREALKVARDNAEQTAAARSAFIANTSHEIRTPLGGILGMVELLLDTELTPAQRRSAELIAASGETLLSTINDVLDLSKFEAGQMELEATPFDLHHLVTSTVRLLMSQAAVKKINLLIEIAPDVPQRVVGDGHRFRQILTNLVGNAVKFTHIGEIVVSVRRESGGANAGNVRLRIGVRDTGIGIAPEFLPNIFTPFRQADTSTTRKYGGTGLGLNIAHKLVGLMGGELTVDSVLKQGSDFHFVVEWPLATDSGAVSKETLGSLLGVQTLVVDHHAVTRRIHSEMLSWAGSAALQAENVDAALAILRHRAKDGEAIPIVICDADMPIRDGFDLATEMRSDAALRSTRVMLLSSVGRAGDDQRCRELGIAAYMQKPLSRVELVEATLAALADDGRRSSRRSLVTRIKLDEGRRPRRVLIAEDHPVNQEVAASLLRKRGHEAVIVANGREAVDAVRKDGKFDMVLMDIQMPELDGISATKEIRALGRTSETLAIVAVTANVSPEERARCTAAGMDGYLTKPFKPHELFAVVEGWAPEKVRTTGDIPVVTPIDLEGLTAMLTTAGIPEVREVMIDAFLEEIPPWVVSIRDAADGGDLERMRLDAHKMASASGTLYARLLASMLRDAEVAAKSGDVESTRSKVRRALEETARVEQYLRAQRTMSLNAPARATGST